MAKPTKSTRRWRVVRDQETIDIDAEDCTIYNDGSLAFTTKGGGTITHALAPGVWRVCQLVEPEQ